MSWIHSRLGLGAVGAALVFLSTGAGISAHAAHYAPAATACGAKQVSHVAAPGAKKSATFAAGAGGDVKVLQTADAVLKVASVAVSKNWTDTVKASSGPDVRVNFFGPSTRQVRFVARLQFDGRPA